MKHCYKLLCILLLLLSCCLLPGSLLAQASKTKSSPAKASPTFTYNIINNPNGGFGYDVYSNGKLLVHQPVKPALPGKEGFTTKAAAEKVAKLVVAKIRKGEMPPTVTIEEMKKLNAI